MDDYQASEVEALERILGGANEDPIRLSYALMRSITKDFSKEIGRGGFGVVYQGRVRNEMVAVKMISNAHNLSDNKFMDEINCLIRAKHKNIVRFLGYCSDTQGQAREIDGKFILADIRKRLLCFEYVPKGNIQQYIEGKHHGDERHVGYKIIKGICEGLHYLHQQRITHLDLKPENVMLDAQMEPKITDFGLSRCLDKGQSQIITMNICGTRGYIAPEVINIGKITLKSDIYALGIMFVKLLTRQNYIDFDNWHKSLSMECPLVVKKSCIEIARTCMEHDQDKRPTAGEILDKLNEMERTMQGPSMYKAKVRRDYTIHQATMEAALVSAAMGALKPVLKKLAALTGDEYRRFKQVRKEISSLTEMHAFLLKMSEVEEDLDLQDKAWMNEVRELSYDMEDSIDDFVQHVDDKDAQPHSFMKKIKHSLRRMKTPRVGIEIQDLKKQIVDVAERNGRYKAFFKTNNASELVGIDEPKNKIVKLLMEDDLIVSAQQQPKMVSIIGFGGVGKTTLANQVYEELKGQFEYKAFLSVSRNLDTTNILAIILSKISDTKYTKIKEGSEQQLIMRIKDFLRDKRYFIVVDDIWDNVAWDVIKCIFPDNSHGSKIITTTRRDDVAESCRSSFRGHIYMITPLDMVHSRQLFHQRLFVSEEDCPPYLKKVSDQILEKCGGLPLAIIVISGLLANTERTEPLWNHVKDSIDNALEGYFDIRRMMNIFLLSYFDLPLRLKTCLLYLSLFPGGCIIEKKKLIQRWIAEGFIHKEGRYTSVEVGEKCFNELINRSLIQPVYTNINGKVESCRVHDIILDFIIFISVEQNFVTLVNDHNPSTKAQRTVRWLSLQVGKQGSSILKTGISLSHVRSLNMFGESVQIPSLDRFKHLRVMDLEGYRQLEKHHLANIGRLFQLRFLSFKGTRINELPEEIGHLRCLETLDLRNTSVDELPKSIVNLENLVHLLGDGFPSFPNGIAKMQALETLQCVDAFEQSLEFLQDLGQLQNMRELELHFNSTASSVKDELVEALVSSLRKLGTQNLSSIMLWFYPCSLLMETWYFAPDLAGLKELFAYDTAVPHVPDWMRFLPHVPDWMRFLVNLQRLCLEVEGVGQKDLCILGGLPALLSLRLGGRERSKEKLIVNGGVGFPRLKEFVYTVYGGMNLMFAAGSMPMPKLEILRIGFDPAKTAAAFDFGIENLPCLVTLQCDCTADGYTLSLSAKAAKAAMERAASTHPNSPTLHFRLYKF